MSSYDGVTKQNIDNSHSKIGIKGNPLFDFSNLKASKSDINNDTYTSEADDELKEANLK